MPDQREHRPMMASRFFRGVRMSSTRKGEKKGPDVLLETPASAMAGTYRVVRNAETRRSNYLQVTARA